MSQFFSGLPFGPSLYFLLMFALFPIGLVLSFVRGLRQYGLSLILLGSILLGLEVFGPEIEYNPLVSKHELAGTWRDGSDRLVLKEDGTYVFSRDGVEYSGTWENDDWNLNLNPGLNNLGFYPRVIRVGSELRIPTNYRSIDLWDGDFGLSR
jgi:hypothetical protein